MLSIFIFSFALLSFKLGNVTLHPWDEAWYASISRNILRAGNWLELTFNGSNYWDHPPLGFWMQSVSFSVFGVSDFSARLPMAIAGALTIVVIYLIGKKLKSSYVGLAAGLILLSSRWWLMRARSGNLDALLVLTQAVVFYLVLTLKNKKGLQRLWFFYGVSFLSKSAISTTLFPLVAIGSYLFLKEDKDWKKNLMRSVGWFLLPLIPWYGFNTIKYGLPFLEQNVWVIGLRRMSGEGVSSETISRTLLYLRSAVHRWYQPAILATGLSVFLVKRKKEILWVLGYLLLTTLPYFLSAKAEIWHMIPAMIPMALLIPLVASEIGEKIFKGRKLQVLILMVFATISIWSVKEYWNSVIDLPVTVSHEARLALEASKSELPLYLRDISYMSTVIFYADKDITTVNWVMGEEIDELPKPFQMIVREFVLDGAGEYTEIARSGDTLLVEFSE
jgi:4-amino-4-deoxy-L-arabinose transferase-like glycosyltransferase